MTLSVFRIRMFLGLPDPHPDSLDRGTDTRIRLRFRIRTKIMSRIHNIVVRYTVFDWELTCETALSMHIFNLLLVTLTVPRWMGKGFLVAGPGCGDQRTRDQEGAAAEPGGRRGGAGEEERLRQFWRIYIGGSAACRCWRFQFPGQKSLDNVFRD